jgi:hypothetical protein
MPKLLPDQSFYPTPTMAMQAPAETAMRRWMTGCFEHPRGQRLAIFRKLEAEACEEKTHCPLGTHVAS